MGKNSFSSGGNTLKTLLVKRITRDNESLNKLDPLSIHVTLALHFSLFQRLEKFCSHRKNYLNPTLACQTKANRKNRTGITGIISARGPKIAKAPGNLLNKIVSIKGSCSIVIIHFYYNFFFSYSQNLENEDKKSIGIPRK